MGKELMLESGEPEWHRRQQITSSDPHARMFCGEQDTGLVQVQDPVDNIDQIAPVRAKRLHDMTARAGAGERRQRLPPAQAWESLTDGVILLSDIRFSPLHRMCLCCHIVILFL